MLNNSVAKFGMQISNLSIWFEYNFNTYEYKMLSNIVLRNPQCEK